MFQSQEYSAVIGKWPLTIIYFLCCVCSGQCPKALIGLRQSLWWSWHFKHCRERFVVNISWSALESLGRLLSGLATARLMRSIKKYWNLSFLLVLRRHLRTPNRECFAKFYLFERIILDRLLFNVSAGSIKLVKRNIWLCVTSISLSKWPYREKKFWESSYKRTCSSARTPHCPPTPPQHTHSVIPC